MQTDLCLATARLTLRPVSPSDRDNLVALEADPQVMRYLNGGQPVPEAGLPDSGFLTPRGTEPEVLAAVEAATGCFAGWFAFFDDGVVNGLRTAEVGYRLARTAWGKGYATEGVKALIECGFEHWGFDCIRAETMAINLASRRVLEKAGMTLVRTFYPRFSISIPGSDQGEVIYAIRKSDLR